MNVICSWCQAPMGEKPGLDGTSHGMCSGCAARMNAELDVLEVERTIEETSRVRRVA
jgi:hypothetical protein